MGGTNGIGTLRERSLHAGLKAHLARDGDSIEALVDGYHIDILRDELLIEIQTGNFGKMKSKLSKLLQTHEILLIYPIPTKKWIVRLNQRGKEVARRKSPGKGRTENVFRELIRMPEIAAHPNLAIELLFTHEEEIWRDDGKGSWRRGKWSIEDRRLLDVVGATRLQGRSDFLGVLPTSLPEEFTNKELAKEGRMPINLATKMTYCLRRMGYLEMVGKRGQAYVFSAGAT